MKSCSGKKVLEMDGYMECFDLIWLWEVGLEK